MTTEMIDRPEHAEAAQRERTCSTRHYRPNVDIIENDNELIVLADMPGVAGPDVEIDFDNGTLTIHGKTKPRHTDDRTFLHCEYGVGEFFRTFQVSESINADGISAQMANGVLTLHLPKVETVKPRKIAVNTR